ELVELPRRLTGAVEPGFARDRRAEIGEVIVRGENVSETYVGDPEAVELNKIRERDGTIWHRTGDVARADAAGRVWLLGRVGDAVSWNGQTLYPLVVEAELAGTPGVSRAALVT